MYSIRGARQQRETSGGGPFFYAREISCRGGGCKPMLAAAWTGRRVMACWRREEKGRGRGLEGKLGKRRKEGVCWSWKEKLGGRKRKQGSRLSGLATTFFSVYFIFFISLMFHSLWFLLRLLGCFIWWLLVSYLKSLS